MNQPSTDWLPMVETFASHNDAAWKAALLKGARGFPTAVVANALIALRQAPEWKGVLHFNESSMATIVKLSPPWHDTPPVPFTWTDEHDVLTAAWLQHQGISVNKEIAGQAANAIAREHSFHPIRDYLNSLSWDGVGRIDDWFIRYLGVDPSEYARAVGAKFLIGGVARVFQPGVKNDTCPILEGPQGAQKSTALRILAGDEFFTDDIAELGSKDSAMQTRGVWIIELAELDSMTRGDQSRAKAFASRQADRIRPPYGKRVVKAPRECVFAGTVNKETYLRDETGGRRYWPVKCGHIKIEDLRCDRDQLWAEAKYRYRAGEKWWLDDANLIRYAAAEVKARYESDPWDERIAAWVKCPHPGINLPQDVPEPMSTEEFVTVEDILIHCIGKRPDSWTQTDQNRVARSLISINWRRKQKRINGDKTWGYVSVSPVSPDEL